MRRVESKDHYGIWNREVKAKASWPMLSEPKKKKKFFTKYTFNIIYCKTLLTHIPLFLVDIYSKFFICHFCATRPILFITAFGKLYELWNSSLSYFLLIPIAYSIISPNITLFSYILKVIILKTFSTTFYNLWSFFVEDDLKGL